MPIPVIQTRLKLVYGVSGTDITEDITPDLLDFSYEDKEKNEADEISVKLKDPDGKWAGSWQPNGGELVKAYILQGNVEKVEKKLYCGKFYIDELSCDGSPRTFTFKAVSIPLNCPIRKNLKNKAWEKYTLREIANRIATDADMQLFFDCENNPSYDRIDQSKESDLKFLSRLCEEAGFSIKVTDDKIVIFDQNYYERKPPIKTITLNKDNILSWSFSAQKSETYKTCTMSYHDPKQDKTFVYTYTDPLVDENGQEYTMKERATSLDEAKRLAKAKLRTLNARKVTGSLTMVGDVTLVAGAVIGCKGFGSFDGNFIVENASHKVGSGYTVSVELRRVNSQY